jgi:hypothetical protein
VQNTTDPDPGAGANHPLNRADRRPSKTRSSRWARALALTLEGGRQTNVGELFKEFPDRIADVALLAGAGYAAHWGGLGVALGWGAAVLAVTTAYIRAQDDWGSEHPAWWLCSALCLPNRSRCLRSVGRG